VGTDGASQLLERLMFGWGRKCENGRFASIHRNETWISLPWNHLSSESDKEIIKEGRERRISKGDLRAR
jgi:hypothetical protein